MIYSCTLFYNELDLLDVKITEELSGGVDKIVVVEASRTHQNQEKEVYLEDKVYSTREDFLNPKVQIMVVGKEFDKVMHPNPRIAALQREAIQRNAALEALKLKDDDVVICADVDEIFPRDEIQEIAQAALKFGFVKLIQKNFNFKINLFSPTPWYCPFAVSGKLFRMGRALGGPLTLNRLRTKEGFKARTNGCHFSFVMTPEQIADKFKAYSHVEFNTPEFTDVGNIEAAIAANTDVCGRERIKHLIPVEIDERWPLVMRENLTKWKHFIVEPICTLDDIKVPEINLTPMPDVEVDFYNEVNDLPK